MKRFKIKAYFVLSLLLGVFLLSGCGGSDTAYDAGADITSIAVTPANPSIPSGVDKQFTATGTYVDGTSADITASAIWSSATPVYATVDDSGLATGVTAGTSAITATLGSKSGSSILTVTTATLVSIAVSPVEPTLPLNLTKQFAATGTYKNGISEDDYTRDMTALVTWTSGTPLVALMDPSGLITANQAGSSVITATFGSISGNTNLTVTAATLESIVITPAPLPSQTALSLKVGETKNLKATGTYLDSSTSASSTVDITAAAIWVSDNPSVATMNPNNQAISGRVTGIAPGDALITATLGGVSSADTSINVPLNLPDNPLAPNLGEIERFVILAAQAVTTTSGSAIVNGDLGILDQARSYYTGFTAGAIAGQFVELTNGLSYAADDATPPYVIPTPYASMVAFINQSRTDLGIAYSFLASDPNPNVATQVCPIELGNQTLTRGVYKTASNVTIQTGDLTLDAEGDPDSVFIFTIGGKLTTGAPGGSIALIGGAQAKNVYWRTAGTTELGTNTIFSGNVFAWTQINVRTDATVTGRLFAVTEQVTLESNNVTKAP